MDKGGDTQFFILLTFFYFLFFSSLVVKPSSYRWIFFPPIVFIGRQLFLTAPTSEPGLTNTIVTTLFTASDYILLTNVQSQFRPAKNHLPIAHAPLFARIKWGIRLFLSPRGVGWAHEPKSALPPHPTLSRTRYVASQTVWLAIYMLMYDIMGTLRLKRFTPVFETEVVHESVLQKSLATFFFTFGTVVIVSIVNTILSIVAVATRLSEPSDWPHIFGQWSDAYTVRKFWGRVWHQLLRRIVSTHGGFVCRILHFKKGTHASSYTQLFIAFAISGLIHTLPGPLDSRPFFFFIAQAVVITFEDIVIALISKMGVRSPPKVVGYVWVWCWFVYSIPPWLDSMASTGMLEIKKLPFSLISGIFWGEWKLSG